MKHLDLFSGIGGFAIAVDEVFQDSEHIFCDNDKFCQQVLKKHWPNSKIYEDIRLITNTNLWESRPRNESESRKEAYEEFGSNDTDILTGGFPCQPFSQAGKRRGTEDDRHLWPEMLRVIRLAKPKWVIAENVRGLLTQEGGLVFEQVCLDLEASDYEVQPFIIPAVAVNAPHRRDRVWFIAHKQGKGQLCKRQPKNDETKDRAKSGCGLSDENGNASNTEHQRPIQREHEERPRQKERVFKRSDWERAWLEVATELCGMDDGLSPELDFAGWSKARHRVERLKSLGNSIVPQAAVEIIKSLISPPCNN